MITAKVTCTQRMVTGDGDQRQAVMTFQPDYQDDRNKEWALATPHLLLNMTVVGAVADQFENGGKYTLQFVPTTD